SRACADSSKLDSAKPIENVLTDPAGSSSDIAATTVLESIPPLRNAPSGTSLSSRRETALQMSRLSSSAYSVTEAGFSSGAYGRSQYCRIVDAPSFHVRTCARGTFRIPAKIERGAG